MADLLSIGSSALLAYRQALDTTGHNIANAGTPGYVRQRTELQAYAPQIGGVTATTITRNTDEILNTRALGDASSFSRLDTFNTLATHLDSLLSDSESGLAAPLQAFFTALNGVAANPNSLAARQVVLGKADTLTARFADIQGQLQSQSGELNARLAQTVGELNNYATSVAQLNERIALAQGQGQTPNDLLDQRDQLVGEIATRIGVSSVKQSDGTLNLYIGSGQALVLGVQSYALGTATDRYNSGALDVTYGGVRLTSQLSGGTIGGLLDYRREMLDPAFNQLGRLAAAVGSALNGQNAAGMDAYGQMGGDFFAPLNLAGLPLESNTGSAAVDVAFGDVSQLGSDDYLLRYNGSAWTLTNRSSGQSVAMSGSGTMADPYTAGGLELTVSGSANAGDEFLLRPTHDAASQLQLAITDPQRIAAATPLTASAALSNTGSGSLSAVTVLDAANAGLLTPVSIQFTSATTYSINGSGSYSYTPGANIDVNGWRLQLSGAPQSGDQFNVRASGANSSSNGNARALAALASGGVLDGGQTSVTAGYTALVTRVGTQAQGAQMSRDAAEIIQQRTLSERDSVSGVNLDEEAADLMRFQQAYQAAAQIISTANTVFQTLLDATRR